MKRIFQALPLLLLALFVSSAAFSQETGYKVGDYATDFSLKNVNEKVVSLAQQKDAKGFIVVFTCNTCPYSKLYEDRLIALHQKYAPQGYPVVAINPNDANRQPEDSFEHMQQRAREKNFPFPYLQDETQEITTAYGATRTPHVYLLNKDRKGYRVEYIGAIDNNHKDAAKADQKFVEEAVDSLLAGRKPKNNFTKAIGCTIKWKEAK